MSSTRFPVSIKGVLLLGDRVVLLKNERDEWELPGGKLEPGEDPCRCLVREIEEELGILVKTGDLIDCWLYDIAGRGEVLIVTYGCVAPEGVKESELAISHEHKELACLPIELLSDLNMPEGYRRSILAWRRRMTRASEQ